MLFLIMDPLGNIPVVLWGMILISIAVQMLIKGFLAIQ